MPSCVGLLQDRWRVWRLPCRQCSGRACGALVFWVTWISNCPGFAKAAPPLCGRCLVRSCWARTSTITADCIIYKWGTWAAVFFPWPAAREEQWRRLSGALSLGTLSSEERKEMLLPASGASRPDGCSVWGLLGGSLTTCLGCSGTFHLAPDAHHFWRHSTGLGGLFPSPCS